MKTRCLESMINIKEVLRDDAGPLEVDYESEGKWVDEVSKGTLEGMIICGLLVGDLLSLASKSKADCFMMLYDVIRRL